MPLDPSYKDLNRASRERIRALANRLTDEELQTRVGEHWTVAIVFAHLAFWERRVMYVLDMTEKNGKLFIPEIAIEECEALDKRLEEYDPALLEEIYNYNKRWVVRALHRNEHLDEADEALKSAGG
jgi:hypothetical protein